MAPDQFIFTPKRPGQIEALTTSADPLVLHSARGFILHLHLAKQYRIVEAEGELGRFKVQSAAYEYRIAHEDDTEIICWHWQPWGAEPRPHAHVPGAAIRGTHIPTGRVSMEAVIRYAITELGATPKRSDWDEILRGAEAPFLTYRTWSTEPPEQ